MATKHTPTKRQRTGFEGIDIRPGKLKISTAVHVTFGPKVPDGYLPVFAVDTRKEALALLTLACPRDDEGYFYAPELAVKQTPKNLVAFSKRLAHLHDEVIVSNGRCECRPENRPCVVKSHFECDGTGQMCNRCGESESACACEDETGDDPDFDDPDFEKCEGCDGTCQICVTHDSPCGTITPPHRCDAVKRALQASLPTPPPSATAKRSKTKQSKKTKKGPRTR